MGPAIESFLSVLVIVVLVGGVAAYFLRKPAKKALIGIKQWQQADLQDEEAARMEARLKAEAEQELDADLSGTATHGIGVNVSDNGKDTHEKA